MKRFVFNLCLMTLMSVFVWSCDDSLNSSMEDSKDLSKSIDEKAMIMAKAEPSEEVGNNLSFPVIFSDGPGATMNLRGTYNEPIFGGSFFEAEGELWYEQQHPGNEWQAESDTAAVGNPVLVSSVDWGDNLEARSWPVGAQIRVETVLYKDLATPMTAFTMLNGTPDVKGPTEVWGTNKVTYGSDQATIYSGSARLVIQKLTQNREVYQNNPDLIEWNGTQWVDGDDGGNDEVSDPLFNGAVWNSTEGPGGYSAEINVQGKVLYGHNWITRDKDLYDTGDYRITFVLDPNGDLPFNTEFDGNTNIQEPEEESLILQEPDQEGGITYIDPTENITYIDVRLNSERGNKGGGKGIGKGGKGGGEGHGRDSDRGGQGRGGN